MSLYKTTFGPYDIHTSFELVDCFSDYDVLSSSCFETSTGWFVELISSSQISSDLLYGKTNSKPQSFTCSPLANENWLQKCYQNFSPIDIGSFHIYGNHLRGSHVPSHKIPIEITAATAFGTGEHPTTNLCLQACELYFSRHGHKKILDLGCGSGILSIALAKLGAHELHACDIDTEAIKISSENAAINHVSKRINIWDNPDISFTVKGPYDMIVANILSEPLISLSSDIYHSLSNNGILIISGFTSDDNSAISKFQQCSLKLLKKLEKNDWSAAVMQKLN